MRIHCIRPALWAIALTLLSPFGAVAADPLPSWNNGPARPAILSLVAKVTMVGSPDFVPPAERIATFDNDGTIGSRSLAH